LPFVLDRIDFGHLPTAAAKHVATKNILAPLLWLDVIISLPAIATLPFMPTVLLPWRLVLAVVPPAFTLLAYTFWTFKEPDRLQSEQYLLEKRWFDTQAQIGDNRTREVIDLTPEQSAPSANTAISGPTNG
jgi:hypothetical protein